MLFTLVPLRAMAQATDTLRFGPAHLGMSRKEFTKALSSWPLSKLPQPDPDSMSYARTDLPSDTVVPGFGQISGVSFSLANDGNGDFWLVAITGWRTVSVSGNPTAYVAKVAQEMSAVYGPSVLKGATRFFANGDKPQRVLDIPLRSAVSTGAPRPLVMRPIGLSLRSDDGISFYGTDLRAVSSF